jgi:hypothetical protein
MNRGNGPAGSFVGRGMTLALVAVAVCFFPLIAQEGPGGQLKHLSVPTLTNLKPLSVAALQVERGAEHPSIIRLKGNVEIKTPVCLAIGGNNAQMCGGYVVVRG